MAAVPKQVKDYSACTTPAANDVLLGQGNLQSGAVKNTFSYKIGTLANTVVPSNILRLTANNISIVNEHCFLVFGNTLPGASPEIVTYVSSPAVGQLLINTDPVQTKANTTIPTYTVTTLPTANSITNGRIVHVSDASGGPKLVMCNGSAWCILAALGAAVT